MTETTTKTLDGMRILVTRAQEQADSFSGLLRSQGANVSEISLLTFYPNPDSRALDEGLRGLGNYHWIIFASQNAFHFTVLRLKELGLPVSWLAKTKIASVGPATKAAIEAAGLTVAFQPTNYVAESLVEQFPGYPRLSGARIMWPKTDIGRPVIKDRLSAAGAIVDSPIAYLTGLPDKPEELAQQLITMIRGQQLDVITLASAQTARNLATILNLGLGKEPAAEREPGPSAKLQALLGMVKIATIGPITARAAHQHLGKVDIEAAEFTLKGLTDALLASLKIEQKE